MTAFSTVQLTMALGGRGNSSRAPSLRAYTVEWSHSHSPDHSPRMIKISARRRQFFSCQDKSSSHYEVHQKRQDVTWPKYDSDAASEHFRSTFRVGAIMQQDTYGDCQLELRNQNILSEANISCSRQRIGRFSQQNRRAWPPPRWFSL